MGSLIKGISLCFLMISALVFFTSIQSGGTPSESISIIPFSLQISLLGAFGILVCILIATKAMNSLGGALQKDKIPSSSHSLPIKVCSFPTERAAREACSTYNGENGCADELYVNGRSIFSNRSVNLPILRAYFGYLHDRNYDNGFYRSEE